MSYKVKDGDGWYRIAKRQGVNINDLLKANNATLDTLIHPGLMLKMPNQATSLTNTTSTPTSSFVSRVIKKSIPLPNSNNTEELYIYGYGTPQKANLVAKKGGLTDIQTKQAALVAAGYDLGKTGVNKDGIDGAWGRKSETAWQQAMLDGYVYENGRLIKPNEKPDLKRKRSSTASYLYSAHPMFGTPMSTPPKVENEPEQVPVNKGKAIYLHYPNFRGKASNALKIMGVDIGKVILGDSSILPVGHGETLLVDENGKVKYVRYGRYKTGTGVVRPSVKGGNWGIYNYPDMKPNETTEQYVNRLLALNEKGGNYLEDAKYGAFEAIEIPNVNYQQALDYAVAQSNDANRPEYSITNTCATGACNTIKAGLSKESQRKILKPTFSSSDAEEVTGSTVWGWIPGSTNKYAQDMRDLGTSYIFNKK